MPSSGVTINSHHEGGYHQVVSQTEIEFLYKKLDALLVRNILSFLCTNSISVREIT
jgi:hypothetical protein